MKKILMSVFIIPLTCILMFSCDVQLQSGPKEKYLTDFRKFISTVKSDYNTYDSAQWKLAERKFKSFSYDKYQFFEPLLSESDKNEVDQLIGQYLAYEVAGTSQSVKNKLSHLYNRASTTVITLKTMNK